MESTVKHVYETMPVSTFRRESIFARFQDWTLEQEKNRFGWMAITLAGHGCVLTPLTLFAIVISGNLFVLWILAIVAITSCLIVNLAALPTRITIPVFFLSILLDVAIIVFCAWQGFDFGITRY